MKTELQLFCTQLLEATANGVYQGMLLAVLVGILLRLLVRTNAATRHAIWLATLMLMVLAVPAHYWLDQGKARPAGAEIAQVPGLAPALSVGRILTGSIPPAFDPSQVALNGSLDGSNLQKSAGPADSAGPWSDSIWEIEQNSPALPERRNSHVAGITAQVGSPSSMLPLRTGVLRRISEQVLQPVAWDLESSLGFSFLATVLMLWLAVALFGLIRLGMRLLQLRGLTKGTTPAEPELAALFVRLQEEGEGGREAELRISGRHRCPLVLGFGRPVILLPADLAAQPDLVEAEHVLRHELAHVRRYDDWTNLVQHVVQAILFYHPAVWWVSKQLTLQREIACDDYVLQHAGGRRSYALILTNVARRITQPTPVLAPGVSNSNSQLQQRINMILNARRNSSPGLAKARLVSVLSATSLIALLALCAGPRFLLAQTPATSAAVVAATDSSSGFSAVVLSPDAPAVAKPSVSLFAHAGKTEPPTPAVAPGAKFKPESPDQEPPEPGDVAVPEPPDAPSVPSSPARVARVGKAGKAPQPPESSDENNDGSSIEQRLRRLEKMVKSLMSQQNPKHPRADMFFKDGTAQNFNIDQQQLDRLKESAERQAARAAEQAQRAADEAKRATKDLEARVERDQPDKGQFREAVQRQIEALREAREGLGQEMERLEREIQKLEKEQERGNKDQQRRSDMPSLKLQAEAAPSPSPELAR